MTLLPIPTNSVSVTSSKTAGCSCTVLLVFTTDITSVKLREEKERKQTYRVEGLKRIETYLEEEFQMLPSRISKGI